ncbi:hypothetical protein [Paenibacillus sp. GCM10012306]|uniref:hypothetical protein n=1 Tax=Paenibacillus sp. GCM10012306 TaxID=3317342 RepID=UPI0036154002
MISIAEVSRQTGFSARMIDRLIKARKLIVIEKGGGGLPTLICKESMKGALDEFNKFHEEYIYFKEVFEALHLDNQAFYNYVKTYEDKNKNFDQKNFMRVIEIREPLYGAFDRRLFFNRREFEELQRDFITLEEAREIKGTPDRTIFSHWLKRRPLLKIFSIGSTGKARYVRRNDLMEAIHNFKPKTDRKLPDFNVDGYLMSNQVMELAHLSLKYFKVIVKQNILSPSLKKGNIKYFKKEDVATLIQRQEYEFQILSQNYYSFLDIHTLHPDKNRDFFNKTSSIKKIEIPPYLSWHFRNSGKWLYKKEDVHNFYMESQIRKSLIFESTITHAPYEFNRQLQVLQIDIDHIPPITKKLWSEFISDKLQRPGNQSYTITSYIRTLVKTTEVLVNFIKKEIYECSSNDINLILTNSQIHRHIREKLYDFIQFVFKVIEMKSNIKPSNIARLINPRKLERKSSHDKKCLTFDEYSDLFKHSINIELHKHSAINSAIRLTKHNCTSDNYDSAWLYVLLHLNNAWRHSDCLDLPIISLEGTDILDLQWLQNNDISDSDIKKIIFRIKASPMIVSKTGAERLFFCAPQLERAFVTSYLICTLKTKAIDNTADKVIFNICDISGRKLLSKPFKLFFRFYSRSDFLFKNRLMNRTVISLVQFIQTKYGNEKDTEYLRILRSHANFETTDIYIDIPQQRLDEISLQLFDRDIFGHIPDAFAEILFGEATSEHHRTKQIKTIIEDLGDIYKIEETAGFINVVLQVKTHASSAFFNENEEYKDIVRGIIKEMSPTEIKDIYGRLITGQLPSKQKNYQCLISEYECKFPGRDCGQCPLSIPHFYALSSVVERIFRKIEIIQNTLLEEQPNAEKTRMANWLAIDLQLLKYAQDKYGKDEVAMFATGINNKLKLIGPIKQYQSI